MDKEEQKTDAFLKVLKDLKELYIPDEENDEIKRILLATAVFYHIDLTD